MFFDEDSLVTWHFCPTLRRAFMMSESSALMMMIRSRDWNSNRLAPVPHENDN
jgi:hypothetical protein